MIHASCVGLKAEQGSTMQVKVRGMRVELGEIENVLSACGGVHSAAARILQHPSTKQKCIVGYVCPNLPDQAHVLSSCRKRLPEHMVPITIVGMEALPCLPNGKVDHKALPGPDWEELAAGKDSVAPRSEAEKKVAAAWRKVLGQKDIGVHTNFFSAGGTSLLAGMIAFEMGSLFEADASVALLFQHPTIADMAEALESGTAGSSSRILPATFTPEEKVSVSWLLSLKEVSIASCAHVPGDLS